MADSCVSRTLRNGKSSGQRPSWRVGYRGELSITLLLLLSEPTVSLLHVRQYMHCSYDVKREIPMMTRWRQTLFGRLHSERRVPEDGPPKAQSKRGRRPKADVIVRCWDY